MTSEPRRPHGPLRRLTLRHWSWLHFKASVLVWAALLLAYTPTKVDDALGAVVAAGMIATIIGAVVSATGLIMSAQKGKTALIGLSIELAGLYILVAGPLMYLIGQAYLATLPDGDQRYALVALAYAFLAAILCRILIVGPRRSREAHDPRKGP